MQLATNLQQNAIADCTMIDSNLNISERPKMHSARFDTPLALVFERFLLAFGGKISKFNGTKRCEILDTKGEGWQQLAPLP